jgi:hypothetical protein
MASHCGERVHFSKRIANGCSGALEFVDRVDTWDPKEEQENRANRSEREGTRELSSAFLEAPMRGAAGSDRHFDWLRCEAPNRNITALEVKR